jgi:hypothetical protein
MAKRDIQISQDDESIGTWIPAHINTSASVLEELKGRTTPLQETDGLVSTQLESQPVSPSQKKISSSSSSSLKEGNGLSINKFAIYKDNESNIRYSSLNDGIQTTNDITTTQNQQPVLVKDMKTFVLPIESSKECTIEIEKANERRISTSSNTCRQRKESTSSTKEALSAPRMVLDTQGDASMDHSSLSVSSENADCVH